MLIIGLFTVLSLLAFALRNGIGPVPTSSRVKNFFIKNLPPVAPGERAAELGAGWGTLLASLSKCLPYAHVKGYENSWMPYLFCRARFCTRKNVSLSGKNFWQEDLSGYSLIVCYLYPEAMVQLEKKLEKEGRKGLWIVTHTFAFPSWKPLKVSFANDLYRTPIYIYQTE